MSEDSSSLNLIGEDPAKTVLKMRGHIRMKEAASGTQKNKRQIKRKPDWRLSNCRAL